MLLALLLASFWLMLVQVPLPFVGGPFQGEDWRRVFHPAAPVTLRGELPYAVVPGAFHPIHLYLFLVWATPLDGASSHALWVAVTLGIVLYAIYLFTPGDIPSVIAVLLSPFLATIVIYGQVTALEVLGMVLLYQALQSSRNSFELGLAYFILSAVPPNMLLVMLWSMVKAFLIDRAFLIKSVALVAIGLLSTLLIYGNWISEYRQVASVAYQFTIPFNLSFWSDSSTYILGVGLLLLIVSVTFFYRRELLGLSLETQMLFVLSSTLLITPYLERHRLFPVYLLACGYLSKQNKYWPLLLLVISGVLFLAEHKLLRLMVPAIYTILLLQLHRMKQNQSELIPL